MAKLKQLAANTSREVGCLGDLKGLFVMRQCGDSVELAIDDNFQPRTW